MKNFFLTILKFLKLFLIILILPVAIYRAIAEYLKLRNYGEKLLEIINKNNGFADYLISNKFQFAWFYRLYTIQKIPEDLIGLDEDEIYDLVLAKMKPAQNMIAAAGLLDIMALIINRIDLDSYFMILDIFNMKTTVNKIKTVGISLSLYILGTISYFIFFH